MNMNTLVYLIVAGIVAGAVAVPIFASMSISTTIYENDGASGVSLAYAPDVTEEDYTVEYNLTGDTVSVGSMTASAAAYAILYADDTGAIVTVDGGLVYVSASGDSKTALGDAVTVTNTAGQVTVSDGVTSIESAPTWAYYPRAGGSYACYSSGDLYVNDDEALAVGGYYAGVLTYNGGVSPDVGLTMETDMGDGVINSVNWVKV